MSEESNGNFVPGQAEKLGTRPDAYDPKDKIRAALRQHYDGHIDALLYITLGDTPIENTLFIAIEACCSMDGVGLGRGIYSSPDINFEPQAQIENFRVDFVFTAGERKLVIECDGHDFHERTKKQAARDKSRDRRLQILGYSVFRFTGSEIYRDPIGCAEQVLAHLIYS